MDQQVSLALSKWIVSVDWELWGWAVAGSAIIALKPEKGPINPATGKPIPLPRRPLWEVFLSFVGGVGFAVTVGKGVIAKWEVETGAVAFCLSVVGWAFIQSGITIARDPIKHYRRFRGMDNPTDSVLPLGDENPSEQP